MMSVRAACDWALPRACLLCGGSTGAAAGRHLCGSCRADLPRLPESCCETCGAPLPSASASRRCGACLTRREPFSRVHAALEYRDEAAWLVRRFKFAASLAAGRELAAALAARLVEDDVVAEVDFLVPVPLHVERLRQRGFDQAAVLAADVSELIGIPVHAALQRTRATAAQSSVVDISTRRRNVRDAFRVVRHVTGARVALVDDVVTTGATASEAARRLRQAGAVEVPVWCCARTPAP